MLLGIFFSATQAAPLPTPAAPQTKAKSYIIQDFHSGAILAEDKADERMEPASITKVMATYVIFGELKSGQLKLGDQVLVSEKAWKMPGSRTFVDVGKRVSVGDLLNGVIIQSGNDATVALAEHLAGSEDTFADLMNQQAKRLGMTNTHYVNSTGLPDPQHYTTARDIATLSRALIRDFPEYYEYYGVRKFDYNGITQYNRNKLLWRDPTVDGIKTGHTESAGYCLASSAVRDGMRLITVVLGDESEESRATSSMALINYGFRFFETHKLYAAGQPIKEVHIWKGASERLALGLAQDLYVTFPRGHYKKLKATADVQRDIIAPAGRHQRYGTLNLSLDDKVLVEQPLVALQAVESGGFFHRMADSMRLWFR